ncbi:MAG: 5-guanidino-2-oxopentanoate decarboxylase [Rhizobiaceae bacterium]|nr:5-guanidino-2-oxopentanoate decarboxylase [Rhizobiaceae bacterium]
MTTLGEALIPLLEAHGVDTVFGIPGYHTVELYRGLARSNIRHVTPRHEQGAGFMADGYARVTGKPGVCFLITGPGLTNALTPMAQARADSIPMLVITSVNAAPTLGKGFGYLHELPDQRGMTDLVALYSQRIESPRQLPAALRRAFSLFAAERPGPVHIEIPLDVLSAPAGDLAFEPVTAGPPPADPGAIAEAAKIAGDARRPLIIAGGGALRAGADVQRLAERLDAPVVLTINARGIMHGHPLAVPASPSLDSVRTLMTEADLVIAAGTEFGPTDFDMYARGGSVVPPNLVRIDIDRWQLERRPARLSIRADAGAALARLADEVAARAAGDGAARAERTRLAARQELGPAMHRQLAAIETIRDTLPGALIVGDSTQPVYAANLFYDHDRPGGWFNGSVGYGALGYAAPAATAAKIALPDATVVCFAGDGGFQFTLPELSVAVEQQAAVIFVVWNNSGYREIEDSMRAVGVEPVGVSPAPPDFIKIADAYGMAAERLQGIDGLAAALLRAQASGKPRLIELVIA